MAQLVVRNLEESVKLRLQERAKQHGHSMEAEIRNILRESVRKDRKPREEIPFGTHFASFFKGIGLESEIPEVLKNQPAKPAKFDNGSV